MEEAGIIIQEWGLDGTGLHTKVEILAALEARIAFMLLQDPMGLIQAMYRLDIPEPQLDAALDQPEAATMIAQLVWDRQLQKSILRRSARPRDPEADEDLAW